MRGDALPRAGLAFFGAPVPICLVPIDGPDAGRFGEVNDAFCEFLGFTRDELVGRPVMELTHPADRSRATTVADELFAGATDTRDVAVRYVRRDGSAVWAHVFVRVMQNESPRVAVSHIIDIDADLRQHRALEASEAHYRTMLQLVQEGIWAIDADGLTTFTNEQMTNLLGYEANEMLGRPFLEFLVPSFRESAVDALERRRRGVFERRVVEMLHRDGRTLWANVSTGPLLNDDGEFVGAVALVIDITEQRAARLALEASERRFRSFVELLQEGIWTIDRSATTTFVNERMAAMIGYEPHEIIGRSVLDFIYAEDRPRFAESFERRWDSVVERVVERIPHRDGHDVWVSVSSGPLRDEHGEIGGSLSLLVDITEEQDARRALEASERRFRALVEHSWDVIAVLGADGAVASMSPAANRLFGWEPHETIPTGVVLAHPADLPQVAAAFREVADGRRGPDAPMRYRVVTAGGDERFVETVAQNLLDDPDIGGIVLNTRDITDRVRAAEQLREQERRLAEMGADAERAQLELELQRARRLETVGRLAGGVATTSATCSA